MSDGKHTWVVRFNVLVCSACGILKRGKKNKPCKGVVRLRPLEGKKP